MVVRRGALNGLQTVVLTIVIATREHTSLDTPDGLLTLSQSHGEANKEKGGDWAQRILGAQQENAQ